jgi:sulfotransferase family protein
MNVRVFGELHDLFPAAHFVHVVRDPRAIVHSMRAVQRRARSKQERVSVGVALGKDLEVIDRHVSAGEAFAESFPGSCRVIHYENLVEVPEREVKGLCEFLGLAFAPGMLETETPNESSRDAIPDDGVWYTRESYDRPIDPAAAAAWQAELDPQAAREIEDHFGSRGYACHARYGLASTGAGARRRTRPRGVARRLFRAGRR